MLDDQGAVAIVLVIHEWQDDEGGSPFGRVVKEITERAVLWGGCRHHAVVFLTVGDILYYLRDIGGHVVVVEQ